MLKGMEMSDNQAREESTVRREENNEKNVLKSRHRWLKMTE